MSRIKTDVATNTVNIQQDTKRITSLESKIGGFDSRITTNTNKISNLERQTSDFNTRITANTSNISNHSTRIASLEQYDYVISKGSSGMWYYRKWDSGYCEFSGYKRVHLSASGSSGNIYLSSATSLSFPFTLTTTYSAVIDSNGSELWVSSAGDASGTATIFSTSNINFHAISWHNAFPRYVLVCAHVTGKYK
ncbi:MAG: hypothetical protein HUJ63_10780 [Enterococcus sp.]|nr:hypothetical protein [Enterococcus sp.]